MHKLYLDEQVIIIKKLLNNLKEDYNDIKNLKIDYNALTNKEKRQKIDSFLFNFTRLQDILGAKFFKNILYELKEIDNKNIPMIDILNHLEKLQIIESIDNWDYLREIRNHLSHEYLFNENEILHSINLVINSTPTLKNLVYNILQYLKNKNLIKD